MVRAFALALAPILHGSHLAIAMKHRRLIYMGCQTQSVVIPPMGREYGYDREDEGDEPILRRLIADGCELIQTLDHLRNVGWSSSEMDKYFHGQRKVSTNASYDSQEYWFKISIQVMKDMDIATAIVSSLTPNSVQRRFLDVGFCPGGYTKYMLDTYSTIRGVGVSLPIHSGGYRSFLQPPQPRLKSIYADVTQYQLGSQASEVYGKLPVLHRSVDLVVLDGHALREHTEDNVPWRKASRLLVSQLILGLQSLRPGGNVILTLGHIENPTTTRLIYLFDHISAKVILHKPTNIWEQRSSFYLVALEVGQGDTQPTLQHAFVCLQKLWDELTFGGEDGKGRGLRFEDLDFITTVDNVLNTYLERLKELSRSVWETQIEGLTRKLKLVKNDTVTST